jgi:hypothetical protein
VAAQREREVRERLAGYEEAVRTGGRLVEGEVLVAGEVELEGDAPAVSATREGARVRVESRPFALRVGHARVEVACERPSVIAALEGAGAQIERGDHVLVEARVVRRGPSAWATAGEVVIATPHLLTLVRRAHARRASEVALAGGAGVILGVVEGGIDPRGTSFVVLAGAVVVLGAAVASRVLAPIAATPLGGPT